MTTRMTVSIEAMNSTAVCVFVCVVLCLVLCGFVFGCVCGLETLRG